MISPVLNKETTHVTEARISYLREAQIIKLKATLEIISKVSDDARVQSLIHATMSDVAELEAMEQMVRETTHEHDS